MVRRILWITAILLGLGGSVHAEAPAAPPPKLLSLDGSDWLLATDPGNVGIQDAWYRTPRSDARSTRVPWIIQDAFPGYHGLAWYWKSFTAPVHPDRQGRYLLRFWAVDYKADVWLNGTRVGGHEGSEGVFVLDVTDTIQPGKENLLAVRVLNPTNEPIDGLTLGIVPRRCKVVPFNAGALYNDGGIVDSVELLLAPAVRLTDLHLLPDCKTGQITVRATAHNALAQPARTRWEMAVAPAMSGETIKTIQLERELPPGETTVEATLEVPQHHLWELNDPYLYRVTARVTDRASEAIDEQSSRCGFRDFRFENGYFRLNGKRIFLRSSHTGTHYPLGLHWPHDPELARRELIQVKAMGFNSIRFFCSVPTRYQLDLCDELGLMIYEESFAGWFLEASPQMAERFDREVREMVVRDRNHPSVIMWGLLNETSDGLVFRHAIAMLPMVRTLDSTRMVMLNSGLTHFIGGLWGLPTIEVLNGPLGSVPNFTYNHGAELVNSSGITWRPHELAAHPGSNGEYAVLRWTAPAAGEYVVSARFSSGAESATTDVHVLQQGRALFDGLVNLGGQGSDCSWEGTAKVAAGETIDFAVGYGNGNYGGDTTAVVASLRKKETPPEKAEYDAGRDGSLKENPHGPWTYGAYAGGKTPDVATFQAFPCDPPPPYGALSNPGSNVWEDVVNDQHPYQRVPHTAAILKTLRTLHDDRRPLFVSEYGIGSGVDYATITRQFEQLGAERLEDAQWYRDRLEKFTADWKRWKLDDTFANPEEFWDQSIRKMARLRTQGLNALRSNPNVVGHSMSGTVDQANCGEGVMTTFRHPKPGATDAMYDGWYPLRWCLFVEPVQAYRNTPLQVEAILANEDQLAPGEYPVRLQIVGPDSKTVWERNVTVTIADPKGKPEPPLAIPVFSEKITLDVPAGQYRLVANFQRGAAAAGRETEFYLADAAELPKVETEVVLWGEDAELAAWLGQHGVRTRPFSSKTPATREVILVSKSVPAPGGAPAFRELAERIARGASVVFLVPSIFSQGKSATTALAPLVNKGSLTALPSWFYHKDEWAKRHPIFDGLPSGGLMDYIFYREIIPDVAWCGLDPSAEAVAGATNTSNDYIAGLLVSVHRLGAGRFVLNTLQIRENLGQNPVANRLLLNLLRDAGQTVHEPLAARPAEFEEQLKAMGY